MRYVTIFLLLFAAAWIAPRAALGQTTRASIEGQVVDETGESLPGANVVAVHEPTGTRYGTTTNENGRYNLLSLRVGGPYSIEVSFVGFETAREEGIELTLGQTRTIDFELVETATQLEEVEVVGETNAILNSERTGALTNISETEIDRLPTIERSLTDLARLTPQATGRGSNSIAGRNDRYNNIQIDGATLNDVFGLGEAVPGSQAGAQPISLGAIQEFNVNIAPFDVRNSGFTGAQINAITKSGTNQFEGSVAYRGRNESFVGDLGGDPYGEFSTYTATLNLGGPIVEDKLFFFVNGEIVRRNDPLSTGIAGSGATNVFPVGDTTFTRIVDIAREQYGYDPGGFAPFTQNQDNNKFLAKLDWNISGSHRLTLRHNYVGATDDDGVSRFSDTFSLSGGQFVFRSTQRSTVAQLNSTFGTNAFNEARLVYTRIRDRRDISGLEPFPSVAINVTQGETVLLGVDRFSQANALDQDLFEITNDFTYVTGNHTLTLGTSSQISHFRNLFLQDLFGTYTFGSVDAFAAGTPTEFLLSYSLTGDPRPVAEFTAYQFGLYAQDEWSVTPDLELTAGLRIDVPFLPQEPTANPDVPQAFPGYSTTTTASGNILWAPRIGFNYSPGGDQETQLRGGTGIFSGRPPFVWISNQYSNTGADVARISLSDVPEDLRFSPDPFDQPQDFPVETSEVNLISEGFKYPQVWRTNLAVDQQLPFDIVGTLEGIYTKSINEVVYENLNLVRVGTSPYGRPLYGEAGFFGNPERRSDQFTDALLLKNTSQGYEYNFTAQLQKEAVMGLSGSLAYTYGRAEALNNATSSRAISNWQFNENLDVNNPRLGTADFETRHRILANLAYRAEYLDRFATTVSLIYDGHSGAPFSWIYAGDANADGQNFNDLVYVPESPEEVVFVQFAGGLVAPDPGAVDAFFRFVENTESLREAQGTVPLRHTARAPWQNILDLRLIQEVGTLAGQQLELEVTLLNVLNLLNSDWGRIQFTPFNNTTLLSFNGYVEEGDVGSTIAGQTITAEDVGKPLVEFSPGDFYDLGANEAYDPSDPIDRDRIFDTAELASRWQLQLGIRYTF